METIRTQVIALTRKKLLEFFTSTQGEKTIPFEDFAQEVRREVIDLDLKTRVGRTRITTRVVYTQEELDKDTATVNEVLELIRLNIFGDAEVIESYQVLSIATPKDYTKKSGTPQVPNSEGDITSESEPGEAYAGPKGDVKVSVGGAIRNKPIQGALLSILQNVAGETGTSIVVYSGGQDKKGTPNARRTGSTRHDDGWAADIRITKDGRRLTAVRSSDFEDLTDIVKSMQRNGMGSVGAGPGYMNGNLHVDIADRVGQGPSLTWGAGGRSANTPSWLRKAFNASGGGGGGSAAGSQGASPKGASASIGTRSDATNLNDMVKGFEAGGAKDKFHPEAYWDYGQWSIGYGTKSFKGETITKAGADKRLSEELAVAAKGVNRYDNTYKWEPHEREALTSFAYNVGSIDELTANGTRSRGEISAKMLEYKKATVNGEKVTLKGLENRRKAEQDVFLNGYA